jgi:hypothetical protein
MIGLVLVTHGKLAEEFRHALEHVVGPQTALETVSIGPEDDMDQRRLDIVGAVSRVENGHGVIILTDMFGGTPAEFGRKELDIAETEMPGLMAPARGIRRMSSQTAEGRAHRGLAAHDDPDRRADRDAG